MCYTYVMKILVATNNQHKLKEMREILGEKVELVSLKEAGIDIDVEENGTTFEENSLIKARTVCRITGLPTLADDTGLMVDALNGAPGVYSARYSGLAHNDKANREKLLNELKNVEYEKRTAHFETVISIVYPNGKEITASGKVNGHILFEEEGSDGFGYDCIFYSDELKKSFGTATADEKNSISHRSRALKQILLKI